MFRFRQHSSYSFQPKLEEKKIKREQKVGRVKITETSILKYPDETIPFNQYGLEEIVKSGKRLEQVPTKVLNNPQTLVEQLPDVPRETNIEEQPF